MTDQDEVARRAYRRIYGREPGTRGTWEYFLSGWIESKRVSQLCVDPAAVEQRAIIRVMHAERERCADILTRRGLASGVSPEVRAALDEATAEILGNL